MKLYVQAALIVLVLGAAASACSSDDPLTSEGASTDLDVRLDSFSFEDSSWEVPAGEEIAVNLTNAAAITHEWVILKPGVTIDSEADLPETEEELLAMFVYWEEEVEAGDSGIFKFSAPPTGEYQVICAIEGHFAAGMEGKLTVSEPTS